MTANQQATLWIFELTWGSGCAHYPKHILAESVQNAVERATALAAAAATSGVALRGCVQAGYIQLPPAARDLILRTPLIEVLGWHQPPKPPLGEVSYPYIEQPTESGPVRVPLVGDDGGTPPPPPGCTRVPGSEWVCARGTTGCGVAHRPDDPDRLDPDPTRAIAPPERPEPPPNRVIREGDMPKDPGPGPWRSPRGRRGAGW